MTIRQSESFFGHPSTNPEEPISKDTEIRPEAPLHNTSKLVWMQAAMAVPVSMISKTKGQSKTNQQHFSNWIEDGIAENIDSKCFIVFHPALLLATCCASTTNPEQRWPYEAADTALNHDECLSYCYSSFWKTSWALEPQKPKATCKDRVPNHISHICSRRGRPTAVTKIYETHSTGISYHAALRFVYRPYSLKL